MSLYAARDRYDYGLRWYVRDFNPSGSTVRNPAQQTIVMDGDGDFAVQKICYSYTLDGLPMLAATRRRGLFSALIFDSTTGRYWSNEFAEIDTIAGFGSLPYVLPTPKVMVAKSEITVQLKAFDPPLAAETPNFVFVLNFLGTKLFRRKAA